MIALLDTLDDLFKAKRTRVRSHTRVNKRTGKVSWVRDHGRIVNEEPAPPREGVQDVIPRIYIPPPETLQEEIEKKARRERREALMNRVRERTREYLMDAKRLLRVPIPIDDIQIDFNLEGTTAGLAFGGHRISYNWNLLEDNEKEFISTTIPHEVAHIVVHYKYPQQFSYDPEEGKSKKVIRSHGTAWKEIMRFFRAPALSTHIMQCEKSVFGLVSVEYLHKSRTKGANHYLRRSKRDS